MNSDGYGPPPSTAAGTVPQTEHRRPWATPIGRGRRALNPHSLSATDPASVLLCTARGAVLHCSHAARSSRRPVPVVPPRPNRHQRPRLELRPVRALPHRSPLRPIPAASHAPLPRLRPARSAFPAARANLSGSDATTATFTLPARTGKAPLPHTARLLGTHDRCGALGLTFQRDSAIQTYFMLPDGITITNDMYLKAY
jgi:hypothetical protein